MTWVFGYGSLVWRPAFRHVERVDAVVAGWTRRFWQGSVDHRGVPGAPGRVVTLVREAGAVCHGVAYCVADADRDEVLDGLDVRERGGYERVVEPMRLADGRVVDGLLYVAGPGNRNWLGPAPIEAIAAQVRGAVGPSGRNDAYVRELAEALRAMGADDPHVFAIDALL